MDAFVLAFTIPNLFRRLFGEGALSAAFIPVFTSKLQNENASAANRLFGLCATALALILGSAALLSWAGCWMIPALADVSDKTALFLSLLKILSPYVALICLAALFSAALQVHRQFAIPALMPVVLNLCWIAGILLLCPGLGVYGMAWAVLIGGILQAALQLPALRRHGTRLRAEWRFRDPDLRRVAALMLPAMLGMAVLQNNVVLDRVIVEACVPGHGGNSALYFGNRLVQFPLGVFGIAMATAVFPSLSSAAAAGDRPALTATLQQALRMMLFISLPAVAVAVALPEAIVALLFQRGHFDAAATARTASVLRFYSLGLWAYCGVQVVTRAFYAQEDTRTPVRIATAMVALNLGLNLTLVWTMRESGLALATAVSSAANLAILLIILRRRLGAIGGAGLAASAVRSLAAAAVAYLGCRHALALTGAHWPLHGWTRTVALVFIPMFAAGALFLAAARLLRMRELSELGQALARQKRSAGPTEP